MIKLLIRVEYGIAFLLLLFIYWQLDFSLWLFFILLLVPDLTMIGYVMNKKLALSFTILVIALSYRSFYLLFHLACY